MRIAIVECIMESNCQDAHIRQAVFIKDYLVKKGHEVVILYIDTINRYINEKYDVIIKSYSTFYENYEAEIKLYTNNKDNARFYFFTNEYTIQSSNVLNKSNKNGCKWNIVVNFEVEKIKGKHWYDKYSVNFNCLFYQPKQKQNKKYEICYFGTYRKDRQKYFKKYFTDKKFILSCSPKSIKKFIKDGCIFTSCKRFVWGKTKDTLGLFKYTLYIEDEYIHNNFNNLSDRFYEALSNDVVILFDRSCINTLSKSEIKDTNYSDFIIDSLEDVKKRDYEQDLKKQREWIKIVEAKKENTFKEIENIIIGSSSI